MWLPKVIVAILHQFMWPVLELFIILPIKGLECVFNKQLYASEPPPYVLLIVLPVDADCRWHRPEFSLCIDSYLFISDHKFLHLVDTDSVPWDVVWLTIFYK